MRLARLCTLLLCLAAVPAWAAPKGVAASAVVDALVMPAWLERQGQMQPLVPGDRLHAEDRIRTGPGARVYLRLPEGSTIKIGADARFAMGQQTAAAELFSAAYEVLAGAFRFTTDRLQRLRGRAVNIRVGTVTAGIRGTDVWGKSEAERDFVILIEGAIEVRHADGPTTSMTEPLTSFAVPRGAAPLPLAAVSVEELGRRARETEIEAGDGARRRDGPHVVILGRGMARAAAAELRDRARAAGYAAETRQGLPGRYDVVLAGFASQVEVDAARRRLPESLR